MPKKVKAIISTHQTTWGIGNSSNEKDANIPKPQTRKMMFLHTFFLLISPADFVNRNKELKANRPKKAKAQHKCMLSLTLAGN
jgi:hypothetical protein